MRRYNFTFYGMAMIVFIIDQITKVWVKYTFYVGESRKVLPFLNFTFVENKGIAFGIMHKGGDLKFYFLLAVTIIAIAVIIYMFYTMKSPSFTRSVILGFIIGGAFGNLYDRIFRGSVVDFIDMYAGSLHWPVFNIADSFITVGILLIFYRQVIKKEEFL